MKKNGTKLYRAYDIVYDTDGEVIDLPRELLIEVSEIDDFDPSLGLADKISDITGWLVESYSFELKN